MEIRQSLKAVKAGYILCVVLELIFVAMSYAHQLPESMPFWAVGILPAVLALFVVMRQIRRRMTRIQISQERLHYETGLLSKATRTVELAKVQDVRVNQGMWERVFNIGTVSLETAGSSSRIVMESIDRPQQVANHILDMAKAAGAAAGPQSNAKEPHS